MSSSTSCSITWALARWRIVPDASWLLSYVWSRERATRAFAQRCSSCGPQVANHPSRNNLVIDAGALALSKDLGATHVVERALATNSTANAGPAIASKWGYVLHHASWNLLSITQELGVIQLPPNEKVVLLLGAVSTRSSPRLGAWY